MNIADNIIKYNLKNVYFFCGTACGGKTTISKALAPKYGFLWFDEDSTFSEAKKVADIENQPALMQAPGFAKNIDWNHYFNRPYKEYHNWLARSGVEQLPITLMTLIKLSEKQKVVVDMHMSVSTAMRITERNRIVFLVTDPERAVRDYCHRPGHQEIYDLIMTLPDPEKSLENLYATIRYGTQKFLDELLQSDAFYIKRDENSTVENTLLQVEKHFGLL